MNNATFADMLQAFIYIWYWQRGSSVCVGAFPQRNGDIPSKWCLLMCVIARCFLVPPLRMLTGVWIYFFFGYKVANSPEELFFPLLLWVYLFHVQYFVVNVLQLGWRIQWIFHVRLYLPESFKLIGMLCFSTTPYWAVCLRTSTTSSSRPSRPALCRSRWDKSPVLKPFWGDAVFVATATLVFLCCDWQLEQFNMMETPVSSDSLYNQTSTLNYSQALMMGLTGGHCSLPGQQQQQGYSNHGNIPNIILTGAFFNISSGLVRSYSKMLFQNLSFHFAPFLLLMLSSKPWSFILYFRIK